jgi:ribonucleotide monophosphatase NagD (HAD superfamily)
MQSQDNKPLKSATSPARIEIDQLLACYDALLLDAYGVLVNKSGPLPGATSLIDRLNHMDYSYLVLTNSASHLPETMARQFVEIGLNIPAERFLTSGSLLSPYFREYGLVGTRCVVLGTEESAAYVSQAGGRVVPLSDTIDVEVVVLADQQGFPLMEYMNLLLSLVIRQMDQDNTPHLLLCNPDLLYPVAHGRYAFTAGGLAAMLEAVINERYAESKARFVRLGKPLPLCSKRP